MKILIVDDDSLVSISLKTILEAAGGIEVIGIGKNGEEAITLYHRLLPDILLMDIRMEKMNGLDAAKIILEQHPEAKILFLTTFADDDYIIKALHIGAKGYILKQNFESIAASLLAVEKGQTVFGGEIITKIPALINPADSFDYEVFGINKKEYELLELVAQGLNNKEISEKIFLSEGTVRNYISILLEKLDLRDRTQLAVFYYQRK